MSRPSDHGWRWLALLLLGPTIWAGTFTAVYGLHGLVCANPPAAAWGRPAMILLWGAGMAAAALVLWRTRPGPSRAERLPRVGLWIGLVATAITLAPLAVVGMC